MGYSASLCVYRAFLLSSLFKFVVKLVFNAMKFAFQQSIFFVSDANRIPTIIKSEGWQAQARLEYGETRDA